MILFTSAFMGKPRFMDICDFLRLHPRRWLVTGAAGFIGSHLVETLLKLEQEVIGLDNFTSGSQSNLEQVHQLVAPAQWQRFHFYAGDIREPELCLQACKGVQHVLHHAAFTSVPASLSQPQMTFEININGFLNLLSAMDPAGCQTLVYASSASVYGGRSPYAASKHENELQAHIWHKQTGLQAIGLRYFNIFGPRQSAQGSHPAVIPNWIVALIRRQKIKLFGQGDASRDFCPVENVVQANLLATFPPLECTQNLFDIGLGTAITLQQLFANLQLELKKRGISCDDHQVSYCEARAGDILHSCADISLGKTFLGYQPKVSFAQGLQQTLDWYLYHA